SLEWAEPLYALRRELGLPTDRHPFFEGAHSQQLALALFSRVMGEPQPDWPSNTVVTGFPFFDRHHEQQPLAAAVERFLEQGRAPVVFTLGASGGGAAGDFNGESLAAVERLGVRALFLTGPHAQGLPPQLPAGVAAVPYAAYSEVFPRAAVVVHQGGIGTTAQ